MLLVCSFKAVDVVGQAGKPKTITGFQTHTTPVLLAFGERAELATEECKSAHYIFPPCTQSVLSRRHSTSCVCFSDLTYTPLMEGFVILRKNPDYEKPEEETKKT